MLQYEKIAGITLVEILWSLTISVLIMSGLISLYLVTEKHFRLQTALISLNENSRITEQLWMTVIRSALYKGCLKTKKTNITTYHANDVKPGTNAITINYVDTMGDDLLFDMKDYSVIYVTSNHRLYANDEIIISDCKSSEVFKVKKIMSYSKNQKIISDKPLKKLYKKYSQVNIYHHESYYIGSTNRYDKYHHVINALYRKNKDGHKTEIIEGINDMKIYCSVIKEDTMQDVALVDFNENNYITGIAILLEHASLIESGLHSTQNIYVAIR